MEVTIVRIVERARGSIDRGKRLRVRAKCKCRTACAAPRKLLKKLTKREREGKPPSQLFLARARARAIPRENLPREVKHSSKTTRVSDTENAGGAGSWGAGGWERRGGGKKRRHLVSGWLRCWLKEEELLSSLRGHGMHDSHRASRDEPSKTQQTQTK